MHQLSGYVQSKGERGRTYDMEATLRFAINSKLRQAQQVESIYSLSSTEEPHLDEEQEEQRNPDIIQAQAPRIPPRSVALRPVVTRRRQCSIFYLLRARILFDQGPKIQSRAIRHVEEALAADGEHDEARAEGEKIREQAPFGRPGSRQQEEREKREQRGESCADDRRSGRCEQDIG